MTKENSKNLFLGLTGRMGSGKGEVVKILESMGFIYTSLSDIVREEIAKLGRDVSRAETQDIGNRLRAEGGAGVLGKRTREKIVSSLISNELHNNWVIDGIRNPAEVVELRKLEGFLLLAVNADMKVILQRIKDRKRSTDSMDDEELMKRLDREWGIGEPDNGQQVGKCFNMADFIINNNTNLEDLKNEINKVLNLITSK